MNIKYHPGLTVDKWSSLTFSQQILNVVSELNRCKNWIKDSHPLLMRESLARALELIDLTIACAPRPNAVKELLRCREALSGFYVAPSVSYQEYLLTMRSLMDMDPTASALKTSMAA
ncbi:MAG: hypothetical protein PHN49_08965 [Candidatus Omnitrophica bacterium]|nr:hypothetical protein [Candidatus Omnitrophota bacterium]MDD5671756.1 hypothetical protein [Candidatus Omnitrophota bacterium]